MKQSIQDYKKVLSILMSKNFGIELESTIFDDKYIAQMYAEGSSIIDEINEYAQRYDLDRIGNYLSTTLDAGDYIMALVQIRSLDEPIKKPRAGQVTSDSDASAPKGNRSIVVNRRNAPHNKQSVPANVNLAKALMSELLVEFDVLRDIVEEYNLRTLTDLFHLQSAIISESYIDNWPDESHVFKVLKRLPSFPSFALYVRSMSTSN